VIRSRGPKARTSPVERTLFSVFFGGRPLARGGSIALLAACLACGAGPAKTLFDAETADATEAGDPAEPDGNTFVEDAGTDSASATRAGDAVASADEPLQPNSDAAVSDGVADLPSASDGAPFDGTADAAFPSSSGPAYQHLAETGLYADPVTRTVAAGLIAFEPIYKLWSDGLTKRRWIQLPPGGVIDTSDMNHWIFPVGTKLWKEFSKDGVLLETRLIERVGTGPEDYWMGAFVWNAEQRDAVFAQNGAVDILGTFHDAPPTKDCGACHRGEAGRVLGFSALQLARASDSSEALGPTLQELATAQLLSTPPPPDASFAVPGDATTRAALGYLHANCGHCHNLHGTAWPDTQMILRLDVGERDPVTSNVVVTTLNKALTYWRGGDITARLVPGHPEASAIYARMNRRGKDQMPPLATEILDDSGLAIVRAWIASLATPTSAMGSAPSPMP